jgi:hypothetical protein
VALDFHRFRGKLGQSGRRSNGSVPYISRITIYKEQRCRSRENYLLSHSLRFGLLAVRSRFVSEAFALDADQRAIGAGGIVISGFDAVRVAEIEFSEIAVFARYNADRRRSCRA